MRQRKIVFASFWIFFLFSFVYQVLPVYAADPLKTDSAKQEVTSQPAQALIFPPALHAGDKVMLSSSASWASIDAVEGAKKRLQELGLKVVMAPSNERRDKDFTGTPKQRAKDLNNAFADDSIKAIFEVRGGFGSAELLPLLDYASIKAHPKIFMGYSDITALLLTIQEKTGLVTFHGPLMGLPWNKRTKHLLQEVLFEGKALTFQRKPGDTVPSILFDLPQAETLHKGSVEAPLAGGNLSVITSLVGTPYQPSFQGKILFLEDVNVPYYRLDRMLLQLQQAGVLKGIRGFVFGVCAQCLPNHSHLQEILQKRLSPLEIPAIAGFIIGHDQNTVLPLAEGLPFVLDADKKTLTMTRPAVS